MKLIQLFFMIIAVFTFVGCATVEQKSTSNVKVKPSTFETSISALMDDDFIKMTKDFSPDLKEKLTEKQYELMKKEIANSGKIISYQYLGRLQQAAWRSELWKINFKKDLVNKKPIYSERMVRIVVGFIDNKEQIIGFLLQ